MCKKKTTTVIEAFALTVESMPFARVDLVQAARRLFLQKNSRSAESVASRQLPPSCQRQN